MRKKKRIAVFAHSHPSISKGGSEIAAYSEYLGLKALGHDVIFVAMVPRDRKDDLILASESEKAIFFDYYYYDYFYNLSHPSVQLDVDRIIIGNRVDVAYFHHFLHFGLNAIRSASRLTTVILTLHEFVAICFHHGQMVTNPDHRLCSAATPAGCRGCFPARSQQQFALRRIEAQEALADVAGFISPSRFLADRFVAWGLDAAKVTVIENGLLRLDEAAARRDTLAADAPWTFGYFGQINPYKGVQTILKAAEEIARDSVLAQSIKISINGNFVGVADSFIAEFNAALAKYPFLDYPGPFDNSRVAALMSACHYVVMPSSWWENSPVVIQEAYAVRRPVLCTGIGGMAEKVVDGVSGLHFERNDSRSLAACIRKACDGETWASLKSGIPKVFSAEDMAQSYLDFADALPARGLPSAPTSSNRSKFVLSTVGA